MPEHIPADLCDIAEALVPGANLDTARLAGGQYHQVVLLPGVAAVRVSRRAASTLALPRRTEVLRQLGAAGLPFAIPEPLTEVTTFGDRAAVAVTWIDGAAHPKGQGDPRRIGALLNALRQVPITAQLAAVLGAPHEYAGGPLWESVMTGEVVPRLPERWQDGAKRRIDATLALDSVPPSLVHGDLGGENVHWSTDGNVIGVLDWDFAQPYDPAIDAACMAWHGWENVRDAVDADTYQRAGTWYRTFGIEQIGVAVLNEEPPDVIARYVENATAWLDRTAGWRLP